MKKKIIAALCVCAMILAAGCADNGKTETTTADTTAEETTAAKTTAVVETTAETTEATEELTESAETEAAEEMDENEETAETEATTDVNIDVSERTNFIGIDGNLNLGAEATRYIEFSAGFDDRGYIRFTNGSYVDNTTNPELFDVANYTYNSDAELGLQPWQLVKVGDKVGDLTVKSAGLEYFRDYPTGVEGETKDFLAGNRVSFDGEITVDALVFYCKDGDGMYTDPETLFVIPDPRNMGKFPLANCSINDYVFTVMSDTFAMSGDTTQLEAGNLVSDYGDTNYADILTENGYTKVTVTLTDIVVSESEQLGTMSSCKIKSMTARD